MKNIDISAVSRGLILLEARFGKEKIGKASTRAVNHTIGVAKTETSKSIRKNYNIKATDAKKGLSVKKATGLFGTAVITASGKNMPLYYFRPTQTKSGAKFSVKKGKRELLRGSFITRVSKSAPDRKQKSGIFVRGKYSGGGINFRRKRVNKGGMDLPITEVRTTSMAAALKQENTISDLRPKLISRLLTRFSHELTRLR